MGILGWIVIGMLGGLGTRAIIPGEDRGGVVVTTVLGMVGAVIGGAIAVALGFATVTAVNARSLGMAAAGSPILLAPYCLVAVRRSSTAY